jgi:hypothetical protein
MTRPNTPEINKIAQEIRRESEERTRAKRLSFDALFAEWLTKRAEEMRLNMDESDRDEDFKQDREGELARLITMTPAVHPWMIFSKLEVLEYYLGSEGGTRWTDNREVAMLAGIKADLLRFTPTDPES